MPALRINLLPAYIGERRKVNAMIAGMVVLVLASAGGMLFWFTSYQQTVQNNETEAAEVQRLAGEVTAFEGATTQIRSQIQPIKEKGDFVNSVLFYNGWRQKIYRRAAQYTTNKVEYNSMDVQADTLTISAYADNVDDLSRYFITFYGNPDVKALSITAPPGWDRPNTQQSTDPLAPQQAPGRKGFPFTVTANLVGTIQPPVLPASLTTAPEGGAGGAATGAPTAPGPDAAMMSAPPPGQP